MQRQPRSRLFNTLIDVDLVVCQPAGGRSSELLFLLHEAGDVRMLELGRSERFGQSCGCRAVMIAGLLGRGVVVFLPILLSQEREISGGLWL